MTPNPHIPFGYKRVTGQLEKGDALWDGEHFRKVKKGFPYIGLVQGFAIRKCQVVQTEIPGTEEVVCLD